MSLQIIKSSEEIRGIVKDCRMQGKTVGFVPTMGALHSGHLKLLEDARKQCDFIISSIFVNPKQFAPHEDLDKYPRQHSQDIALMQHAGVDIAFMPDVDEIYPTGFDTTIITGGATLGLESTFRPHFFHGVCTVLTKLFIIVMPDKAFFGEKDFQQYCVVKKLVTDLNLPIEIIPVVTVREQDGLALSSRNVYLNETERNIAPKLYQTLCRIGQDIHSGRNVKECLDEGKYELLQHGFTKVDYLSLYHVDGWIELKQLVKPTRLLAAVWLGNTRLIDNIGI
jgi:pantoate--beta-alanine ligase